MKKKKKKKNLIDSFQRCRRERVTTIELFMLAIFPERKSPTKNWSISSNPSAKSQVKQLNEEMKNNACVFRYSSVQSSSSRSISSCRTSQWFTLSTFIDLSRQSTRSDPFLLLGFLIVSTRCSEICPSSRKRSVRTTEPVPKRFHSSESHKQRWDEKRSVCRRLSVCLVVIVVISIRFSADRPMSTSWSIVKFFLLTFVKGITPIRSKVV